MLVHRASMRVVDGAHRIWAAQLRGERTIAVEFFDGADDLVFPAAVRANVAHGLPLSLADRRAAAARILLIHEQWSDRTVAAVTGLAHSTVAGIRRQRSAEPDDPAEPDDQADDQAVPDQLPRVGRDGRVRPLSTAEGRRLASTVLAERPNASLREVARAAGVSTGTVRDVRRRLARGEDPVPARLRTLYPSPAAAGASGRRATTPAPSRDGAEILQMLRQDPALRFNEAGRGMLRWLAMRSVGPHGWQRSLRGVPVHCGYFIAELAEWCAAQWLELAEELRAQTTMVDEG